MPSRPPSRLARTVAARTTPSMYVVGFYYYSFPLLYLLCLTLYCFIWFIFFCLSFSKTKINSAYYSLLQIKLVAPPLYVMVGTYAEKDYGVSHLTKAIELIQEELTKRKGELVVKVAVCPTLFSTPSSFVFFLFSY